MLLASKYEDMYPPVVRDFAYITANAYTAEQIVKAEIEMLLVLEFSLEQPVPLHFLQRFVLIARLDLITHEIAKYLLELCLVHGSLVSSTRSSRWELETHRIRLRRFASSHLNKLSLHCLSRVQSKMVRACGRRR